MSGIEFTFAADRRLLDHVPSWRKFATLSGYCYPEDTVLALVAQARNAALEDAARVADAYDSVGFDVLEDAKRVIATAIRTLSTQDTPDMRATNKGEG